jgi:hypothetical protein
MSGFEIVDMPDDPQCFFCGCTDEDPCIFVEDGSTCWWVHHDPPTCSSRDCAEALVALKADPKFQIFSEAEMNEFLRAKRAGGRG